MSPVLAALRSPTEKAEKDAEPLTEVDGKRCYPKHHFRVSPVLAVLRSPTEATEMDAELLTEVDGKCC